jgi:hypothetical protein
LLLRLVAREQHDRRPNKMANPKEKIKYQKLA